MKKHLLEKDLFGCCQALNDVGFELTEVQNKFCIKYSNKLARKWAKLFDIQHQIMTKLDMRTLKPLTLKQLKQLDAEEKQIKVFLKK